LHLSAEFDLVDFFVTFQSQQFLSISDLLVDMFIPPIQVLTVIALISNGFNRRMTDGHIQDA